MSRSRIRRNNNVRNLHFIISVTLSFCQEEPPSKIRRKNEKSRPGLPVKRGLRGSGIIGGLVSRVLYGASPAAAIYL